MNKTKLKLKIGVLIFLLIIGLTVGFFFSGLINLALSTGFRDITQLAPKEIWDSLLINKNHRMLLLCLELITTSLTLVLFLTSKRETFESDVTPITETIKTPIAIGQGQHGTARWLKKFEQRKTFSMYRLDSDDKEIRSLLNEGLKDIKEVEKYGKEESSHTVADKT